jgi:hypothetical protein
MLRSDAETLADRIPAAPDHKENRSERGLPPKLFFNRSVKLCVFMFHVLVFPMLCLINFMQFLHFEPGPKHFQQV